MHLNTALVLAGTAQLINALPARLQDRAATSFSAGVSFNRLLTDEATEPDYTQFSKSKAKVAEVDLSAPKDVISDLKEQDKKVICWFNAGAREAWREDAGDLSPMKVDKAKAELVDVKSKEVITVMKKRIKDAATKGCDAVNLGGLDGYVRTFHCAYARVFRTIIPQTAYPNGLPDP